MNQTPLVNPHEDDFDEKSEDVKTDELLHEISKDQLKLDVTPTSYQVRGVISGIRMGLRNQEKVLEISQFWRSLSPYLMLSSAFFLVIIAFVGGIANSDKIGPTIPLFYDSLDKQFISIDKIFIYIAPLIIMAIEGVIFRLMIQISNEDKRLSIASGWIVFFLNILILIALSQIYKLIT